jgi:ABC-type sugar transport system permease subunit
MMIDWLILTYLAVGYVVAVLATLGNEGRDDWRATDALLTVVFYPVYIVVWAAGWAWHSGRELRRWIAGRRR